eukprot:TRINITY_DN48828_c0_g1_i1.p1 TRINITY_DN48828_c0_g1~~TRINITY_DN48828_c0_g1_i1.p1  ORF type:complete len:348 (-),score=62.52 TRINITY_DN48828_c0_g1_i1:150-1193(-)
MLRLPLWVAMIHVSFSMRQGEDHGSLGNAIPRSNSMGNLGGRKQARSCLADRIRKSCSSYLACVDGQMVERACAAGLAYSRESKGCTVSVNVGECPNAPSGLSENLIVRNFSCRSNLIIVGGPDAQEWLQGEVVAWQQRLAKGGADQGRPEAIAAANLVRKEAPAASQSGEYYASVTEEDGGTIRVQAIARVVTSVEENSTRVGIPAIFSRRSLFGKADGIGSAGRGLIAGLVEALSSDDGDLRLGGTPGDAFVNALYHAHGADNINASNDPEGVLKFGTLELRVPKGCGDFFERAMCDRLSGGDYLRFTLRLAQPESTAHPLHVFHTCSDMFPKRLVLSTFQNMFG